MYSLDHALIVYRDLADHYQRQNEPGLREIFLVLAADAALKSGQATQAENLRAELLRNSPYHLLKPYASFAEAMQHPDIENYVTDLRDKYPLDVAQDMLEPLLPGTTALSAPEEPSALAEPEPRTLPPVSRPQPPPTRPLPPPTAPLPPIAREEPEPLAAYPEPPPLDETQPPPTLPPMKSPLARQRGGLPRPAPVPQQRPRPAPPPPPARRPQPAPLPRGGGAPLPRPGQPAVAPTPGEPGLTAGSWVGTLLFVVVLVAGLALLGWTLFPRELLGGVIQGF